MKVFRRWLKVTGEGRSLVISGGRLLYADAVTGHKANEDILGYQRQNSFPSIFTTVCLDSD